MVASKRRRRYTYRRRLLTSIPAVYPPPQASTAQDSMPAEPPQLHTARKRRNGRLHTARERPPWAVLSRVEPYERCMKATLPQAPSAEPRAATPTAARPKLAVHTLQAWPLACAAHRAQSHGQSTRPPCTASVQPCCERGRAFDRRSRAHLPGLRPVLLRPARHRASAGDRLRKQQ